MSENMPEKDFCSECDCRLIGPLCPDCNQIVDREDFCLSRQSLWLRRLTWLCWIAAVALFASKVSGEIGYHRGNSAAAEAAHEFVMRTALQAEMRKTGVCRWAEIEAGCNWRK